MQGPRSFSLKMIIRRARFWKAAYGCDIESRYHMVQWYLEIVQWAHRSHRDWLSFNYLLLGGPQLIYFKITLLLSKLLANYVIDVTMLHTCWLSCIDFGIHFIDSLHCVIYSGWEFGSLHTAPQLTLITSCLGPRMLWLHIDLGPLLLLNLPISLLIFLMDWLFYMGALEYDVHKKASYASCFHWKRHHCYG